MSSHCTVRRARTAPRRFSLSAIPLACHAFAGICSIASFGAAAQDRLDPVSVRDRLDPVIVTATREPQPASRSPADVVVIDAATIRASSADSLEDLLRREAGVQIGRNGGPGQSAGYFIRGASSSGTVVLLDGVRIGSASLGQVDLESLDLAQVDHIEVLRGPASGRYGADAVGGVVQIFTRRGEGRPHLTADAAFGGYGSRKGDLGLSGAEGGFDYAVSAGHERSRGTSAVRPNDQFGLYNPDDDGFHRTTANLRAGYTPAAGHRVGINLVATRLETQYDGAEYNPPDFAPDASPDFRTRLKTGVAALDYRGELTRTWTTTLQAATNVDDSRSGGTTSTRYETHRDQASWQHALQVAEGQQVVLAYEFLRERVESDVFGVERQRHNNAVLFGYSASFGPHALDASLRRDDNSVYGADTTGSLGWRYEVAPGWTVRALAGTTFRAPTFNDLYFPQFGVETLAPERGRSVEVGAAWQSGGSRASATLYRNRVKDLIGYQSDRSKCPPATDFDYGCADNTSRARLQGATLEASQRWGGLDVRASVDFLDAKNTDTGERLARRAAHQESLRATYDTGAWTFGGALQDTGSRPDGGAVLGGYALVDFNAAYRFLPQWRIEAKLLNAFDHRVEPVRDYAGLGRQGWIGVRFDGEGL